MALRRLCGPDGRGGRQMSVQHSAAGPEFNHTRDQPDTQVLNAAGFSAAESAAMDSALAAAAQGPRGANPLVGAVVYAIDDPHDPAAGGAATLRAAGVRVRSGLGAVAALDLNRRWFDAVAAKRPFVTLHIAQTLDGRIAASDGTSQWISSAESLADNHALRGRIDAILVGTP